MTTGPVGRAADGDALSIRHLSKRFGGAVALDDVSMTVRRGEVHGLLGSNGSGKSTLIKILAGFHTPEPGAEIRLYGERLALPVSGSDAREKGLAFVHQHLGLIPSLSVAENFFMGSLSTGQNWAINWRTLHREAGKIFQRFGLQLDPAAPVAALSAVQQALLAIVRAYEGYPALPRKITRTVPGFWCWMNRRRSCPGPALNSFLNWFVSARSMAQA